MGTQNIASLTLSATAKKAAEKLLEEYPDIELTSGRRDLAEQASAMAANVVQTRDYIVNTYKASDASRARQKWVDDHPEAKTPKAIADFGSRTDPKEQARAEKSLKACLEAIAAFKEITGLMPISRATSDDCAAFQRKALSRPKNWRHRYPRASRTLSA
jgi:hypothetical protein